MNCDHEKKYCPKHDAYYCVVCDVWLEKKCSDKTCQFCHERPDRPSMIDEKK